MTKATKLNWGRILLSVVIAEVLPIMALVAIVIVYEMFRSPDSATPEDFAPRAGQWVGPISGFLATLIMARWSASRASDRRLAHGLTIGVGTALLDWILGFSLAGRGALEITFVVSNVGRVLAGLWGGYLASKGASSKAKE